MNKFVNRTEEMASLRAQYRAEGASLYVLYGRRRLGKTTLIREFSRGLPAVYHMADRSTEREAMRFLAQSLALALNEPTLQTADYHDWYALFGAYDRVRQSHTEKALLILDEYQYLCETQPAFSSILQKWWDQHWKDERIMLVLSGSAASMMHRETLSHSSPLFGRRTGQWLLLPLRFRDATTFFAGLPARKQTEMWALTGGVPHYAQLASGSNGMDDALDRLVLDKGGPLHDEAKILLRDEVTAPNTYASLMHCIGSGASRVSEIAGRVGLPANQLTRYISVLQEQGLVRREVSVDESNPEKSKRGLYEVADPFLRLWFGCVRPYEGLLELGRIRQAQSLMRERLTAHKAWAFEAICRQFVEDRSPETGLVRVGRLWDGSLEIDVAGVDERGDLAFAGECKWSSTPVGRDVGLSLQRKVESVRGRASKAVKLAVFSASGFNQSLRHWAAQTGAMLVGVEKLVEG